jgi:4-amino-4-deoxy-L-arabinose transferase-like glycosyltransferase
MVETPMDTTPSKHLFSGPFFFRRAFLMGGIFVLALVLRFWQLDFGLPDYYHSDEPAKLGTLERVLEGKSPGYLRHPGLLVNALAWWNRDLVYYAGPVGEVQLAYRSRALVALVGALLVLPAFLLGRALFGVRGGLLAAAILAVAPSVVVHSRYHKEDIFLTFFVLTTTWAVVQWIRAPERRGWSRGRWIATATIAAGLAMASKYVGVMELVFACAVVAVHGERKKRAIATLIVGALAMFLLASPQIVREFSVFVRDFGYEYQAGVDGAHTPGLKIYQWPDLGTFFFRTAVGPGLGWPLAIIAAWGGIIAWRKRQSSPEAAWVAVGALAWYVLVEFTPRKRATDCERYLLPCIALCAVLAAGVVTYWRPRWNAKAWGAIGGVALAWSLAHTVSISSAISHDTRRESIEWLARHKTATPLRLVYLNASDERAVHSFARGIKMTQIDLDFEIPGQKEAYDKADAILLSEFATARFEDFPNRSNSKRAIRRFDQARADFPYAVFFRRPFYEKMGWHNPDIELRFRQPVEGTERVVPEGTGGKQDE